MKKVIVYTDGAARGNPGRGGYGTILIYGKHRKEFSQGFIKTTNNRMELLAVIVALEALNKEPCEVEVYSDSKYVVDSVMKKWVDGWVKKDFKDKKNVDLWKRFLIARAQHKVTLIWVKGHAGNPLNERCDELAVNAADGGNLIPDDNFIE